MGEAKGCVHVAHRWTSSLLRIGWWRGKKNKRPLIVQPVPKREIEFVVFVSVVCYIVYIRFCGFSSDPEINAMRFVVVFERSDLVSFFSFCEILPPPVVDGINVIHNSLLFWLEIFLVSLYYIFCVGFCSLYSTFGFWSITSEKNKEEDKTKWRNFELRRRNNDDSCKAISPITHQPEMFEGEQLICPQARPSRRSATVWLFIGFSS